MEELQLMPLGDGTHAAVGDRIPGERRLHLEERARRALLVLRRMQVRDRRRRGGDAAPVAAERVPAVDAELPELLAQGLKQLFERGALLWVLKLLVRCECGEPLGELSL